MGIPSYYKTLCDRIPGLLSKHIDKQPTHFWVDFNCMIYHCIRRPGAIPYPGSEGRLAWENALIQTVVQYVKKLVEIVKPTEQVFLGLDGVVPMAKLRQQRLRRFKSLWTAAEETKLGIRDGGEHWDTNAITPGTAFMERLGTALHALPKVDSRGCSWIVSATDEPGEGEHKLIERLRDLEGGTHSIYGLDADLIVLSLLQTTKEICLFREAIECGEVVYSGNDEEYRYFSIEKLSRYIFRGADDSYKMDYCMGMSLLGNDFVPHGLTFKLKDGGHDALLAMLRHVRAEHGPLIDLAKGSWRLEGLRGCFQWLAVREQDAVALAVADKLKKRWQRTRGTTPQEHAADEWNKTPLRTCEEMALLGYGGRLREDWQQVYRQRWLNITTQIELDTICTEYCRGLVWVLDYYKGGATTINNTWHFPWYIPPLWSDLAAWSQGISELPTAGFLKGYGPLKPQEQLALVLPIESYWLIRDKTLRKLPTIAPQLWPRQFELFSAGRKQLWECEAVLPLITPQRLRVLLGDTTESINRNGTTTVSA